MDTFDTINPYSQKVIASYVYETTSDGHEKLIESEKAFQGWRRIDVEKRKKLLLNLAERLESEKKQLAELATEEMGKPIAASNSELEKCIGLIRYYADTMAEGLKDHFIESKKDEPLKKVVYQPLGPILGIMPWNYPFWQVLRFAIPTIAAGNSVLLKHAENVTGCAYSIERLFAAAGFPKALFQVLLLEHEPLSKLIAASRLKGVSLTGSVAAGKKVAETAGRNLKPSVMELGGSDPYLVLEDADLSKAAKICAQSRLQNSGQTCISAKRFFVDRKVFKPFLELLTEEFKTYGHGDPTAMETKIGPIARKDLLDKLHKQRAQLIDQGFVSHYRSELRDELAQSHCAAEILVSDTWDSNFGEEELFGPIAMVFPVESKEQAIEYANQSPFGLGAAVFSSNLVKANQIAKYDLQAGSVAINQMVSSTFDLPFGGIGQSGFGRELALEGLRAFVNVKSIVG